MKIYQPIFRLLYLFIFLLSSNSAFSKVIYSANSTSWALPSTWQGGEIPTSADTVIIDGHEVSIINQDSFAVRRLEINNTVSLFSRLIAQNDARLHVLENLVMTADNFDSEVYLSTNNNSIIYVDGNLLVTRQSPGFSKKCQIHMIASSKINVNGNFIYNYSGAEDSENADEILMIGLSKLEVDGMTNFNMTGGLHFQVNLSASAHLKLNGGLNATMTSGKNAHIYSDETSHIEVGNDVLLQNVAPATAPDVSELIFYTRTNGGNITIHGDIQLTTDKQEARVYLGSLAGTPIIKVLGDIIFDADFDKSAHVYLDESATLQLGGDILRPNTDFGRIYMSPMSTFEFNGTTTQTIPQKKLAGSGQDSIVFTNQKLNNSSGFILDAPLRVTDNLNLERGVIVTDNTNKIILAEGATITGGNDSSYVQGPITKQGAINGESFVFPVGDSGKYAPVEIKPLGTSSSSEYTAQYFKCPPPYGLTLTSPLDQISGGQFWKVERTVSSEDFDITLHWRDASAEGITDTSTLVVAGLNDTTVGAEVWEPMGKSGVTFDGVAGSVTNDEKCPPPYGRVLFTLGSKAGNALPSELISFEAKKNGDKVYLDWVTASEVNSDYFLIEKSTNGIEFERVDAVNAQGNSNILQYYSSIDEEPIIGTNYYRIQRVDQNGMSSPTNTISIKVEEGSNPQVNIFPNPVQQVITIETVDFETDEMDIEVYYQNGQKIYEGKIAFGNRRFTANATDLNINAIGVYTIVYHNSFRVNSLKFIKM